MNTENTKENSATPTQDMVPAGIRKIVKFSQLPGFTARDGKIVIDATSIYADGFSQGYSMGKDEAINQEG